MARCGLGRLRGHLRRNVQTACLLGLEQVLRMPEGLYVEWQQVRERRKGHCLTSREGGRVNGGADRRQERMTGRRQENDDLARQSGDVESTRDVDRPLLRRRTASLRRMALNMCERDDYNGP